MRRYLTIVFLFGSLLFWRLTAAQVQPSLKTTTKKLDKTQSGFSKKLAGYPMEKNGKDQLETVHRYRNR
ncbi:MAG: hypothetical protein IPI66_08060 [Chitinophagaceae bacterium]|nr:hypothetical protein [Chitinophagaceae bacterium]